MESITVSLIQSSIVWENPKQNHIHFAKLINSLKGKTDLVLLPETFSTGFSMDPQKLAESMSGPSVSLMKKLANENQFALGGSIIITENENCYNRFVFVEPNGNMQFYDKRHLFRMAGEHEQFSSGNQRKIIEYKGFRFLLQVCYDLRFPVFMRNRNDYDVILLVANWPGARSDVWKKLLYSRAIENQCYVVAANRIGVDGKDNDHSGDSMIIDFKGNELVIAAKNSEEIISATLSKQILSDFKAKFPAWIDADDFTISK
jgi:omega-amidase